jgi:hypothetical protein
MFSNFGPWFFGISRLCNACKNGDLEQVKRLATKQNINQRGWLGWAPLHKGPTIFKMLGKFWGISLRLNHPPANPSTLLNSLVCDV